MRGWCVGHLNSPRSSGEPAPNLPALLGVVRMVEEEPGFGVFFAVDAGPVRPGVVCVPNPAVLTSVYCQMCGEFVMSGSKEMMCMLSDVWRECDEWVNRNDLNMETTDVLMLNISDRLVDKRSMADRFTTDQQGTSRALELTCSGGGLSKTEGVAVPTGDMRSRSE